MRLVRVELEIIPCAVRRSSVRLGVVGHGGRMMCVCESMNVFACVCVCVYLCVCVCVYVRMLIDKYAQCHQVKWCGQYLYYFSPVSDGLTNTWHAHLRELSEQTFKVAHLVAATQKDSCSTRSNGSISTISEENGAYYEKTHHNSLQNGARNGLNCLYSQELQSGRERDEAGGGSGSISRRKNQDSENAWCVCVCMYMWIVWGEYVVLSQNSWRRSHLMYVGMQARATEPRQETECVGHFWCINKVNSLNIRNEPECAQADHECLPTSDIGLYRDIGRDYTLTGVFEYCGISWHVCEQEGWQLWRT